MAYNIFSTVFIITVMTIADPVYTDKIQGPDSVTTPSSTTEHETSKNDAIKALVDSYKEDKNWSLLKSGLLHELSMFSPAYNQVLNISDGAPYPLEQISTTASYLDLLNILLDGGLEPDTVAGRNNWTMLHYSAENNTVAVAELLLRRGADPDARTSTRDTPIIIAAWRNNLQVVRALKENGADLDSQNDDGRTALHRAAYWGNADVVRYLVNSGANKTITTKLGNTPLDDARNRGYSRIIEMLS